MANALVMGPHFHASVMMASLAQTVKKLIIALIKIALPMVSVKTIFIITLAIVIPDLLDMNVKQETFASDNVAAVTVSATGLLNLITKTSHASVIWDGQVLNVSHITIAII